MNGTEIASGFAVAAHLVAGKLNRGNIMCLAIPGKILNTQLENGMRTGRVQFGGIVRNVCLDYVPEAEVGDYVMVHVGFAISRVDAAEAERTFQALEIMGVLEAELADPNAANGSNGPKSGGTQ